MKKNKYIKPEQNVVVLRYKAPLLIGGSLNDVENKGLDEGDDLIIDNDTPVDDSFWGR